MDKDKRQYGGSARIPDSIREALAIEAIKRRCTSAEARNMLAAERLIELGYPIDVADEGVGA